MEVHDEDMAVAKPVRDEWYRSAFEPELADFPEHPKQDYVSVFMEPEAYRDNWCGRKMGPITVKIFGAIFHYTQTVFYYFLVFLLGFFLSFMWALVFSMCNFFIAWMIQPTTKIMYMFLRITAALTRATVRSMLDPVFESWGQCFSFFRGRFGFTTKKFEFDPANAIQSI